MRCIRPHEGILAVRGAETIRVFALGPPRDASLLAKLTPESDEEFHVAELGLRSVNGYFGAAVLAAEQGATPSNPFSNRFCIPWSRTGIAHPEHAVHLDVFYGGDATPPSPGLRELAMPGNAPWRRIDHDWLHAAEQLATDMSDQTNNSSLVLAFELGKGGKVLLFAAHAQRGS